MDSDEDDLVSVEGSGSEAELEICTECEDEFVPYEDGASDELCSCCVKKMAAYTCVICEKRFPHKIKPTGCVNCTLKLLLPPGIDLLPGQEKSCSLGIDCGAILGSSCECGRRSCKLKCPDCNGILGNSYYTRAYMMCETCGPVHKTLAKRERPCGACMYVNDPITEGEFGESILFCVYCGTVEHKHSCKCSSNNGIYCKRCGTVINVPLYIQDRLCVPKEVTGVVGSDYLERHEDDWVRGEGLAMVKRFAAKCNFSVSVFSSLMSRLNREFRMTSRHRILVRPTCTEKTVSRDRSWRGKFDADKVLWTLVKLFVVGVNANPELLFKTQWEIVCQTLNSTSEQKKRQTASDTRRISALCKIINKCTAFLNRDTNISKYKPLFPEYHVDKAIKLLVKYKVPIDEARNMLTIENKTIARRYITWKKKRPHTTTRLLCVMVYTRYHNEAPPVEFFTELGKSIQDIMAALSDLMVERKSRIKLKCLHRSMIPYLDRLILDPSRIEPAIQKGSMGISTRDVNAITRSQLSSNSVHTDEPMEPISLEELMWRLPEYKSTRKDGPPSSLQKSLDSTTKRFFTISSEDDGLHTIMAKGPPLDDVQREIYHIERHVGRRCTEPDLTLHIQFIYFTPPKGYWPMILDLDQISTKTICSRNNFDQPKISTPEGVEWSTMPTKIRIYYITRTTRTSNIHVALRWLREYMVDAPSLEELEEEGLLCDFVFKCIKKGPGKNHGVDYERSTEDPLYKKRRLGHVQRAPVPERTYSLVQFNKSRSERIQSIQTTTCQQRRAMGTMRTPRHQADGKQSTAKKGGKPMTTQLLVLPTMSMSK